jgi:hypothetical protein
MEREAIVLVFVAVGGLLIVASGLVNHPERVPRFIDFIRAHSDDNEDAFEDKFVKRVDWLDPADRSLAQSSR